MSVGFYRFSTAGNTTLFVEEPDVLPAAMQSVPAEQAGYIDLSANTLKMAADEFCLNASLAFAALVLKNGYLPQEVRIAGMELPIFAMGVTPLWQCGIEIPLAKARIASREDPVLVHLPGISHLLLPCNQFYSPAQAMEAAANARKEHHLDELPAAGVVWWRELDGQLEILPVISAPGAGTVYIENACGSASLSLAVLFGQGEYSILQPSGQKLHINVTPSTAVVQAPVRLLASGELWLS